MNPHTKDFIIRFFLSGLFFAAVFLAFDIVEGQNFKLFGFIFRFIVFGLGLAIIHDVFQPGNKKKKYKNIS
jgi:hypothetical protein